MNSHFFKKIKVSAQLLRLNTRQFFLKKNNDDDYDGQRKMMTMITMIVMMIVIIEVVNDEADQFKFTTNPLLSLCKVKLLL